VYAVGQNTYGQLGQNDTVEYSTPQLVDLQASAVKVTIASYTSIALLSDGTLWGWGYTRYYKLDTGLDPVTLPMLIDAGPVSEFYHNTNLLLFRHTNGNTYFTGTNENGNTFVIGGSGYYKTPERVLDFDAFDDIKEYEGLVCGVNRTDDMLYCRGDNSFGGVDESGDVHIETMTLMFGGVQVQKYGINEHGVCVFPESATGMVMANAVDMDIVDDMMGLVTASGEVFVCGEDTRGRFGYGAYARRYRLTQVPDVSGAVSVHVLTSTVFAVTNDNALWSWGTKTPSLYPAPVFSSDVLDFEKMGTIGSRVGIGGESFWRTYGQDYAGGFVFFAPYGLADYWYAYRTHFANSLSNSVADDFAHDYARRCRVFLRKCSLY